MNSYNQNQEVAEKEVYEGKLANTFNKIRTIFMGIAFIAMGVCMVFAFQLKLSMLYDYPNMLRYMFGGICFLYGGFRFWRAFN